jgi:hypothetical protein
MYMRFSKAHISLVTLRLSLMDWVGGFKNIHFAGNKTLLYCVGTPEMFSVYLRAGFTISQNPFPNDRRLWLSIADTLLALGRIEVIESQRKCRR